jgi:hypothetical protein
VIPINPLPKWCIPDIHPAYFDHESATSIEMVAKLYGAIKTIIENYNSFIEDVETRLDNQDEKINETIGYIKANFSQALQDILNDMLNEGSINVDFRYDKESESINFVFVKDEV